MKKLKIAFFGGTFANLEIYNKCKLLGAECYLLDKNKNCFAKNEKNFRNIDFNNKKKVIEFIIKNNINFLYTTQSDVGIKSLGYLNSRFDLPGTSHKLAQILTDKYKIRKILHRKGFQQPKFFLITSKSKNFNYFKDGFLIKPVDSSGSRGIFEITKNSDINQLIKKTLTFSKSKKLILEEKIEGSEFGAQTFSINGRCKNVILHDDFMSSYNEKIPIGHAMPFSLIKNSNEKFKIKKIIKRAVDALGVENGPCNVDCIYSKAKKLYILEVSPRVGATCLPNMLKIYTGIDWDINTIKLLNFIKIKKIEEKKINVFAKVFESNKSGIVKKIRIKRHSKKDEIKFLVKNNQKIEKFTNGSKLFGYIVAFSKNRNYLIKNINKTIRSIKIKFKK